MIPETRSKLPFYLMVAGLVFLVCSAIYAGLMYTKYRSGAVSDPIGYNVFYPSQKPTNPSTVRYYTGNTFAELDTTTGKTTPLTKHLMISNVIQAYWLNDGVIFNTSSSPDASDLAKQQAAIISQKTAVKDPVDYSSNIYWYLSFKDDSIKYLRVGSVSPVLFGIHTKDGGFLFREDTVTYGHVDKSGVVNTSYVSLPADSRAVYADDMDINFVHVKNNKLSLSKKNITTSAVSDIITLAEGDGVSIYGAVATKDGETYVYDSKTTKNTSACKNGLVILKVSQKKCTQIEADFSGNIYIQPENITVAQVGKKIVSLFSITNALTSVIGADLPFSSPASIMSVSPTTALYSDINGKLYLTTSESTAPKTQKAYSGQLEKVITLPNNVALTRNIESISDNDYTITYIGIGYQAALDAVRSAVYEKGYDPNQFSFTMNPGAGAN